MDKLWNGDRQRAKTGYQTGDQLLWQEAFHQWQATEPRAVTNFLPDIEKSLSYLQLPLKELPHRSELKTVDKLESLFRGLRRRINNIGTFENIKSSERHLFTLIIINRTKQHTPYMLFTQNS